MIFRGISIIFSTAHGAQYAAIGQYWDDMSNIFGRENIRGLGYNWMKDTIEYVIGMKDNSVIEIKNEELSEKYSRAVYKEISLPDYGWKTYTGETNKLAEIYKKIYEEGSLNYEIESFSNVGTCKILINRENL